MFASTSTSRSRLSSLSSDCQQFVVITFPGYVKNIDKAVETLGGQAILNQTHFAGRPLELRHRPENPYGNALVSERRSFDKNPGSGTVLGVIKIRRKKADPKRVESEFLGLVTTVYTFKSMCDFQYLPLKKNDPAEKYYEDQVPKLIPNDLPSSLSWWEHPDIGSRTSLFLPPYQFSRYNTPSVKILSREADFSLEKTKKKTAGPGQSLRSERKSLSVTVHSLDVFPLTPSEEAVADANARCKNEKPHRLLQKLFEERPMWTRVAISRRTQLEDFLLKALLQKFAFYIASGPWGRLWCRFGYDPRVDPKAKRYQTIMVTFRQHSKIPERQRLKVVNLTSERALPVSLTGSTAVAQYTSSFSQAASEPIEYVYTPGKLPRVRQMWYSLCDVHLSVADEIVQKEEFFAQRERADEQYGWLKPDAIESVREAIKEDVKKVSEQLDEDFRGSNYAEIPEDEWP